MGLDRFPGSEIKTQTENIQMHNDTWGVYGPSDGLGQGVEADDRISAGSIITGVVFPIIVLIVMCLMGYLFATWMFPEIPVWSQLSFGSGMLLGAYSFGGYLIMVLGGVRNLSLTFFLLSMIFSSIFILGIFLKKISPSDLLSLFKIGKNLDLWIFLLVALGGLFAFLAAGSGFHETDSIVLWGAKAEGIIIDGLPGMVTRGTNTTVYPLHIPLLLSMFIDLFGFVLPAAKLIFPLYYLLLLLFVYGFLKGRIGKSYAGLSTLLVGTMPLISRHAMIAYANLPFTFYLVGAVITTILAMQERDNTRFWIYSGICFSLSVWTRPEGFLLAVASILFILILHNNNPKIKILGKALWIILPPLLVYTFWLITKGKFYTGINPVENTLKVLINEIGKSSFHIDEMVQILRYLLTSLFDFQAWGMIGIGLILAYLSFVIFKNKPELESRLFCIVSALMILPIVFMYYVFSYDLIYDIQWWLTTGFNRMVMPGMISLWLGIVLYISPKAREEAAAEQ